jgi:hypothetical protein
MGAEMFDGSLKDPLAAESEKDSPAGSVFFKGPGRGLLSAGEKEPVPEPDVPAQYFSRAFITVDLRALV